MAVDTFHFLVWCHIVSGAIGLVAFWVPIASTKGGTMHVRVGKIFTYCMLITGFVAIGISTTTLIAPVATHPAPELKGDAALIRGIFGWMMQYLAILTINLAWFGWLAAKNKRDHSANLEWRNVILQVFLTITAINCLLQGVIIGQGLMIAISFVGFATVATNVWFLMKKKPGVFEWQLEHVKALVGAGISVYTAFLAFGAVRLMPSVALNPMLWAIPLTTGIGLIVYHQQKVKRRYTRPSKSVEQASPAE
ncbi:MAG: hypothetical protein QNJ29_11650 [Rhizobiaceae bacterium]|nr:hypothetical protein [Rhizobiaceae bacterium]